MVEVTFDSKETPLSQRSNAEGEFTQMLGFYLVIFIGRTCTGVCVFCN